MSTGWIDLGKPKGNIGNQNYVLPDDVDIGIHNSVTIWCKPFNVIFSVAVLSGPTRISGLNSHDGAFTSS